MLKKGLRELSSRICPDPYFSGDKADIATVRDFASDEARQFD